MKTKCHDCIYYDEFEEDCTKDQYDGCGLLGDKCTIFKARKECEHRYENCDMNGCSIICHRCPSERECDFYYECKLDNYACDENCIIHEKRAKLNDLKYKVGKLNENKHFIEKLINEYNQNIDELNEELKTIG